MKKVLITGISGFVGSYLYKYKPNDIQLTGTYLTNKPDSLDIQLKRLDLNQVDEFILKKSHKYDVIIHCAAESSLVECEKNPEKSFFLNTQVSEKLAQWSADQKSKFIFLSTDIVFDGKKGEYFETTIPKPINVYGQSKYEAEQKVSMIHDNAVIARLALCLGLGIGKTNSFIDWFLAKLESDEPIPLYYDEFRTPVSVKFVAQAIWELANNDFKGIIHLAGKEKINRYDFGGKMLEYLQSDKCHLLLKESSSNSIYLRPKDVSMKSKFLDKIINVPQENITTLIENIL